MTCMNQSLEDVFAELGIPQYLDVFVDQGFDSWDTILDITESDLDTLGVKLGHRRKLQRRIANSRGLAPDVSLVSLTRPSIEDSRHDVQKQEAVKESSRGDATTTVVAKRKYRRHPKADENAPERPPSAYVLFSNKMRDDLKGRNLTFTEIAKLVGENWQNLSQPEKEPYESQAQTAKEKYNHDLAEYKKTSEYRRYMVYLQDFKVKHANQTQEKDGSKRVKLSTSSTGGILSGLSSGVISRSGTGSGSGSENQSQVGSEPPPITRQRRVDSTASLTDSQHSYAGTYAESLTSPSTVHGDHLLDRSPGLSTSPRELPSRHLSNRNPAWIDSQRVDINGGLRSLPSLSDVFDGRASLNALPPSDPISANGSRSSYSSSSPGPPPGLVGAVSRPPSLKKQDSSGGSMSSGGSATSNSYPRTPVEASLPIHALLSGTKTTPYDLAQPGPPVSATLPLGNKAPLLPFPPDRAKADIGMNTLPGSRVTGYFSPTPSYPMIGTFQHAAVSSDQRSLLAAVNGKDDADLDGISALLRAREIVERRDG